MVKITLPNGNKTEYSEIPHEGITGKEALDFIRTQYPLDPNMTTISLSTIKSEEIKDGALVLELKSNATTKG